MLQIKETQNTMQICDYDTSENSICALKRIYKNANYELELLCYNMQYYENETGELVKIHNCSDNFDDLIDDLKKFIQEASKHYDSVVFRAIFIRMEC